MWMGYNRAREKEKEREKKEWIQRSRFFHFQEHELSRPACH